METNERRPLFGGVVAFRVTPEDCDWQMVASDVLCIHPPSGSRGVAHDRNQAFARMAETDEFKNWRKAEAEQRMGAGWSMTETTESDDMYDWQMTEGGVRCTHRASGAIAEAPDRFRAWKRMYETDVFQQWRAAEMARRWGNNKIPGVSEE